MLDLDLSKGAVQSPSGGGTRSRGVSPPDSHRSRWDLQQPVPLRCVGSATAGGAAPGTCWSPPHPSPQTPPTNVWSAGGSAQAAAPCTPTSRPTRSTSSKSLARPQTPDPPKHQPDPTQPSPTQPIPSCSQPRWIHWGTGIPQVYSSSACLDSSSRVHLDPEELQRLVWDEPTHSLRLLHQQHFPTLQLILQNAELGRGQRSGRCAGKSF